LTFALLSRPAQHYSKPMPLKFNMFKNRGPASDDQFHVQSNSSRASSYVDPAWSSQRQRDHDAFVGTGTRRARAMARVQDVFKGRSHDSRDAKPVQRVKWPFRTTQEDSRDARSSVGSASPKQSSAASDFAGIPASRRRTVSVSPRSRNLEKVPGSSDWWAKVMEERDAPTPKRLERILSRTMSDPEFSFKMVRTGPLSSYGLIDRGAEAETCPHSLPNLSDFDNCDDISEGLCAPEEVFVAANATDIPEQAELDLQSAIQDAEVVVNITESSQAVTDTFDFVDGLEVPVQVCNAKVEEVDILDPQPSQNVVVNVAVAESVALEDAPPLRSISVGDLGHQVPRKDLQILCRLSVVQQRRAKHQHGRESEVVCSC